MYLYPMGADNRARRRALAGLDPRTRVLALLALTIGLLLATRSVSLLLVLAVIGGLVQSARVNARVMLRGIFRFAPWLLMMALVQLLFGMGNAAGCRAFWQLGRLTVTTCTLNLTLLSLLRFVGFFALFSLTAAVVSVSELARAIESLARPFQRLGLPAGELALAGVIAVRFVPTMALELERLKKAQMARGANFGGGRLAVVRRVRNMLPLIVPVFILALRRAERLGEAMEARAYSSGGRRGAYSDMRFRVRDWLVMMGLSALLGIVIGL